MGFLEPPTKLEPKYKDTFDTWQRNPNKATATKMLSAIQPEIDKGISAHVGYSSPLLKSRARRIALKAVGSYDPTRARLGTHVVNQLQGLKRIARQQNQILPEPERVSIDRSHVDRASNDFLDQNGREASISELADATGLSVKRLKHIQKFQHPIAEGTITARMAESEDGGFMPAVEQDGGSSWLEFVYDDLDPINQKIMEWTLGLHGQKPLSNRQVAAKLRISPGAVSQRKAHIQGILDQEQQLSPFYG